LEEEGAESPTSSSAPPAISRKRGVLVAPMDASVSATVAWEGLESSIPERDVAGNEREEMGEVGKMAGWSRT
jgi:hypothetical protein